MALSNDSSLNRSRQSCPGTPPLPGCKCSIALNPPPDRPDPAIYSQIPRLSSGLDVTWNNPDITLFAPPLLVGGDWQVDRHWFLDHASISVHNLSTTAAAINTLVSVSTGALGIGMPRDPVVTQLLSLAGGETRVIDVPFSFPPAITLDGLDEYAGMALVVDISHPYDADKTNNHGESITGLALINRIDPAGGVVLLLKPISISLGNTTAVPLVYVLTVAPNTVSAQVEPAQVTVAPGATGTAFLRYSLPPAGPVSGAVTILAHDLQGNFIGGLTEMIYSN
jgi:hypothetical protein